MKRLVLFLTLMFPLLGCAGIQAQPSPSREVEISLVNAPSPTFAQRVRIDDEGEATLLYSRWPRPMLLGRSHSKEVLVELFDTSGALLLSRKAEYGPRLITHSRKNRPLTLSQLLPVPADSLSQIRITFFSTGDR